MGKQVKVVVMRHPEKDGDRITAHGAQQAWAAAEQLKKLGYVFNCFVHSGAKRAEQAIKLVMTALDTNDLTMLTLKN